MNPKGLCRQLEGDEMAITITRDSYTVESYGDGQYRIECSGITYDTGEADILGFMPVMGDTTMLYRDKNHGYFLIGLSPHPGHKPSFTKLHDSTGKQWELGISRYWEAHNADM